MAPMANKSRRAAKTSQSQTRTQESVPKAGSQSQIRTNLFFMVSCMPVCPGVSRCVLVSDDACRSSLTCCTLLA